jgi:hypothetical protein
VKLYIKINDKPELDLLKTLCDLNFITANDTSLTCSGVYCLDNTAHIVTYPSDAEVEKLPASFVLKMDYQHIEDLYLNKVLARFNEGKLEWTLMNADAMAPMIQVLMYGCKKYERNNWMKASPKRLSLMDSLQRHALKIIAGESIDPESGLPHIGHLMCNAMFYSYWEQKTNGQFENFESTK